MRLSLLCTAGLLFFLTSGCFLLGSFPQQNALPALAHDAFRASVDSTARPEALPPRDSLLSSCFAALRTASFTEATCRDGVAFFVGRFDVSATARTCRRIAERKNLAWPNRFDVLPDEDPPASLGGTAYAFALAPAERVQDKEARAANGRILCAPHREGGTVYVQATHGVVADATFLQAATLSILYDGFPGWTRHPANASWIPFLGRPLSVPTGCRLVGPRDVACQTNGPYHHRMDWDVYSSRLLAQEAFDTRIEQIRQLGKTTRVDTPMTCSLEGQDARCHAFHLSPPSSPFGLFSSSSSLIGYVIEAEVRGRPTVAVCSFPPEGPGPDGLPNVCANVLSVPDAARVIRAAGFSDSASRLR